MNYTSPYPKPIILKEGVILKRQRQSQRCKEEKDFLMQYLDKEALKSGKLILSFPKNAKLNVCIETEDY